MSTTSDQPFDMDGFYSAEPIDAWRQIIGDDLHYHFGYFRASEDLQTGLRQAVANYFPHIEPGSRVLDVGCGWGGPARMLMSALDCPVTGVTASTAQSGFCRQHGIEVLQCDLDQDDRELPGGFDLVFSLEMISHIRDKAGLLRRLRACGRRLILSESCAADGFSGDRETFGGSIQLCTVSELLRDVEAAGWHIQSVTDRRFASLRTIILWKQNLDRLYGDKPAHGQLGVLRSLIDAAAPSPLVWGQAFPLIDLIAD